ncbi:Gag-Pol polyprotein, partial [Mucuna pruriens]
MDKNEPWFEWHPKLTRTKSKVTLSITYGMIPIFGDFTVIKSLTIAFRISRSSRSSIFIIWHLEVATTDQVGRSKKYSTMGSIGPPFSETLTNMSQPMNNYVSRWVEAKATKTNDDKVVMNFLKSNIFCTFGVPKALISDQGSHFYNRTMSTLLEKYGVVHRVAITYHPQTNDQAKNDWSRLLEDALWTHRTTYRTPLGMSPCWIAFDKACHLPELEELCLEAYENSRIYKRKNLEKEVLSRPECALLIVGKLRSRWDEPFIVTNIFPYGAVELRDEANNMIFKVNGH